MTDAGRVAFRPSQAFFVINIAVWSAFVLGAGWGVSTLGWLGPDLRFWTALVVMSLLGALAITHLYGAFLSGPSLIADRDGLIFRDGKTIWGPVGWDQVSYIGLDDERGRATVHIILNQAVRKRALIGLGWVLSDRTDGSGALLIAPHAIDNQGEAAYAALSKLHEAAR